MKVYRITTLKWSTQLSASGFSARWNSKGKFMIYTAGSRALACLENVVHRSGEGLNDNFRVMVINIPSFLDIESLNTKVLPESWSDFTSYHFCQQIGNEWLDSRRTAILQVPSVIIKKEFNYLINPNHEHFKNIKLESTEKFDFDSRIKD
ncbi:MAG: RES family NAD+ phosphorylase [Bacteroidota bacterium]